MTDGAAGARPPGRRDARTLVVADAGFARLALEAIVAQLDGVAVAGALSPEAPVPVPGARPDVVLIDLDMRAANPVAVVASIRRAAGPVPVVGITRSRRWHAVLGAPDRGVTSMLLEESCEPAELRRVLLTTAAGRRHVDPGIAGRFVAARSRAMPLSRLSERRREVLDLLAHGLTNGDVAGRLSISERTVKTHLTRIYRAIGVGNRTQAALWARSLRAAAPPVPDRVAGAS